MRFAVIGNGKMAIDTLLTLAATPGAEVALCLGDPRHETAQSRLAVACAERCVPYRISGNINDADTIAAMREVVPDYLVSANNFQIFRAPSLAVPRLGVVNFHNAPLPRYGGLNACSWALLNDEREHGVTWHLVDGGIDSGPILAQHRFPIEPEDTAISLISRCIRLGSEVFRSVAKDLVEGTARPRSQDRANRTYFGVKDRPWGGDLPWWEPAADLHRLARALSFHPMPNMFYRPRLAVDPSKPLFAERIGVRPHMAATRPGTVVETADDEITVELCDGLLMVGGLVDGGGAAVDGHEAVERFGLKAGSQLSRPLEQGGRG